MVISIAMFICQGVISLLLTVLTLISLSDFSFLLTNWDDENHKNEHLMDYRGGNKDKLGLRINIWD